MSFCFFKRIQTSVINNCGSLIKDRPKDALSSIAQAAELKPTDARLLNRKNEIHLAGLTYDGPAIQVLYTIL